MVLDALYVGSGHEGFESTRERMDLKSAPHGSVDPSPPGNLLPSLSLLHLFVVQQPHSSFLHRGHNGEHH
jgi:hypothetical protein